MSIYFNIPAGTYNGRAVSARTVKVDRGFSETNSIRVRESTLEDFPFQHIKVHDINERNTDIKLTLNVKTESEYLDILKYFESLKGCKSITLTYPDSSTKKIIITQWSTTIQKGGYGNLNVSGELVY